MHTLEEHRELTQVEGLVVVAVVELQHKDFVQEAAVLLEEQLSLVGGDLEVLG